jgi:hypothetical protein
MIVVAAVNSVANYTGPAAKKTMSVSNYGPTDDGRIRHVAKGVESIHVMVQMMIPYEILSGTSMAAPAITGLIVLMPAL